MKTEEEFKKLVVDALEMQTELDYVITHELGTAEARQNLKSAGTEIMDAYKEALREIENLEWYLSRARESRG